MPVIGYQTWQEKAVETMPEEASLEDEPVTELSDDMKQLEDRAHAHKVLLSSDAMRHFISVCPHTLDRLTFLERVMGEAKISYPTEDGWVVLNLTRMQELCAKHASDEPSNTIKVGVTEKAAVQNDPAAVRVASSLAEAIVTGNVVAAYQLMDGRPMVALAEAAADLDAIYRHKRGEQVVVSDLLVAETAAITPEAIKLAVMTLSTSLDGTYSTEEAAVKIAVMKAMKTLRG